MDLHLLATQLPRLAGQAVRTFFNTLFFFLILGIALAVASYFLVRDHNPSLAVIAALLALAETAVVGFVLAGKRAVGGAIIQGLAAFHLGRTAVELIFGRLMGVADPEKPREEDRRAEGVSVVEGNERMPVAVAEERLEGTLYKLVIDAEERGGLQGKIQRNLNEGVRTITLDRFQKEGGDGTIDLPRLKQHLENNVDAMLIGRFRDAMRFTTGLFVAGLLALVALQVWLLRAAAS